MRILVIFISIVASITFLKGQKSLTKTFTPWEGGLFLGGSYYQGDVHCRSRDGLGVLPQTNLAYGLFLKRNLSNTLGIKVNVLRGSLTGSDLDFEDNTGHVRRGFSFESPLTEFSGVLEWDLLGNRRYSKATFQRVLSPYLIGGLGVQISGADVNWNSRSDGKILTDQNQIQNSHFVLPYGIGLRYNISDQVNIAVEGVARKVFSDYLDGISESGNPDVNDWDGFAGVTLGFKLGKSADSDGDGIKDNLDACPTVFGIIEFMGCPDTDRDGIQDKMDACPNVKGEIAFQGCPDTDKDGVQDSEDRCPTLAGNIDGCPDTDGDGIIDPEDACPEISGTIKGCPDADKDGVADKDDICPTAFGLASLGGCPDTDGDGVIDNEDKCPTVPGLFDNAGCPFMDTDADGIEDKYDNCPGVPGPSSNKGCPVTKVLSSLMTQKVYYDNASSIIRAGEVSKLREILEILTNNPDATVELIGQTDYRGNSDYNDRLSQNRTSSVIKWLVSRGVAAERITSTAVGEVPGDGTTIEELQEYRSTVIHVKGLR